MISSNYLSRLNLNFLFNFIRLESYIACLIIKIDGEEVKR